MTDYSKLDEAITAFIKVRQPCTFRDIADAVESESKKATIGAWSSTDRAVDRRLQSLRKRSIISYASGGWRATT